MANNLNILIADDEASLRYSLGSILQVQGYSVSMVENGLEAVEAVKTGNFDVVFLDIKMPEMNGVEASKEIKKFNKKIVIIIMTAYALIDLIKEAEKEAFLVVDKPFDIPKILRTLERIASPEKSREEKIAAITGDSVSVMILEKAGYNVSVFQKFDEFLDLEPESFRLLLVEPASEDELNNFLQKLKEKDLDLKVVSIINFDSPVLSFLETNNLLRYLEKCFYQPFTTKFKALGMPFSSYETNN
ncbi:response regulator [Candidatus Endomicrobiellum devescovinae]|uniref:response regulator n=1 Tax=Candidatus Endomicrobiellum devescovinae TaxID=3242322 RepID=UPI00281DBBF4|nr:response regulator [Endomicrobium sp.]